MNNTIDIKIGVNLKEYFTEKCPDKDNLQFPIDLSDEINIVDFREGKYEVSKKKMPDPELLEGYWKMCHFGECKFGRLKHINFQDGYITVEYDDSVLKDRNIDLKDLVGIPVISEIDDNTVRIWGFDVGTMDMLKEDLYD